MSIDETSGLEGHDRTDLESRDVRALTECMTVLADGDGLFTVTTESGSTYTVDASDGVCSCPDFEYRGVRCKHLRRVVYALGETSIPASVVADVDPLMGEHVDATPVVAATDGGTSLGVCEGREDGESDVSPRSDCWCDGKDLACFDHFTVD